MPPGGTHQAPKPLVAVTRPVGQNDVGMVAWTLTMKTPECPQGRKVRAQAPFLCASRFACPLYATSSCHSTQDTYLHGAPFFVSLDLHVEHIQQARATRNTKFAWCAWRKKDN